MFAIKATYRGETRKFSLSRDRFPSFEQLRTQLYRVFPIIRSIYLSKLLFSPNAAQGGRILIGQKVNNQEDYNKSITPYKDRVWPNGLLRFTVYDEDPGKVSNMSVDSCPWTSSTVAPPSAPHISPSPFIVNNALSAASAMDVDSSMEGSKGNDISRPCCSVQSTKRDIETLIKDFKNDLDHVLKASFVTKGANLSSSPLSTLPLFTPSSSTSNVRHTPHTETPVPCSSCARQIYTWNLCGHCHLVECDDCSGASTFCFGTMAGHQWSQHTGSSLHPWFMAQDVCQDTSTVESSASMPSSTSTDTRNATPVARPVIHHNVICDSCCQIIEGVRHKCLDCPDYDLCNKCINLGETERHDRSHQFIEIATPGRVVVHRIPGEAQNVRQGGATAPEPLASHFVSCDLCDSRIEGDRYKCLVCPDFDTCSSCFSITESQHPGHGFAKLRRPEDYIRRFKPAHSPHFAACNVCTKKIYGVRYKCMHADCPDFDLCEVCEAHPIALHPENHPLLKMKTPNTVVPNICRHEQSPPRANERFQPNFTAVPNDHEDTVLSPVEPSRNPFLWGFMHSPRFHASETGTPVAQPALIPRLDEISPSVNRTLTVEEVPSIPIAQETSKPSPVGETVLGKRLAAGDDEDREGTPSPIRVRRAGERDCQVRERTTWPGSHAGLEHLMKSVSLMDESESTSGEISFVDSPLTGEETLLKPPSKEEMSDMQQRSWRPVSMDRQKLAMLLSAYQDSESVESLCLVGKTKSVSHRAMTLTPEASVSGHPVIVAEASEEKKSVEGSVMAVVGPEREGAEQEKAVDEAKANIYLSAMFVEDTTVSDGQIFPPGAEFMKCWRMLNDSEHDWPETTELIHVAGERLGMKKDGAVQVGMVKSGTEVEIWTGELKAPDVAGRYVSYWRLRDGDGMVFGDSIWIDIVVVDAHSSDDDKSIASSLVVMPNELPNVGEASGGEDGGERQETGTLTNGTGTLTAGSMSVPSSGDSDSGVSLVSIPSSEEENWEDVGSSVGDGRSGDRNDYVVLYDDRSSEDE